MFCVMNTGVKSKIANGLGFHLQKRRACFECDALQENMIACGFRSPKFVDLSVDITHFWR